MENKDRFAVISLAGKQYLVREGDHISIDRHEKEEEVTPEVLLVVDGDDVKIGTPVVDGATVKLKVKENKKGPKIRVMRFRAKSNYHRTYGHRQPMCVLEVVSISA